MKRLPYLIILILIAAVIYLLMDDHKEQTEPLQNKIDSLLAERTMIDAHIESLVVKIAVAQESEDRYLKTTDSLQKVIDLKPLPCEHELTLVKLQNTNLKKGWEQCREAKPIYQKMQTKYAELVINHQVTCPEQIKLAVVKEKQKGKVWKWIAGVGWVAFLIVLI